MSSRLPPSPEMIALFLTELAAPTNRSPALSVSIIERRLSGLAWNYTQYGFTLDRKDRHIATVLAGIKRKHARPSVQKEAILPEYILAVLAILPFRLRGLSVDQHGRTVLQQTEKYLLRRNPLRQNRRQFSGVHRHHTHPPLAPPSVNMT